MIVHLKKPARFWKRPLAACLAVFFCAVSVFLLDKLFFWDELKLENSSLLVQGDLIFLKGHTIRSKLLYAFTNNDTYSHVGMVVPAEKGFCVIHANPDSGSPLRDAVIAESIDAFIENASPSGLIVLRLKKNRNIDAARIQRFMMYHLNKHTRFDHQFSLATDRYMYCTELVFKAFSAGGVQVTDGRFDYIDTPLVKGRVILPETIMKSKMLEVVLSLGN